MGAQRRLVRLASLICALTAAPAAARASTGVVVAANDGPLSSRAAVVVVMREGTRTVLTMQNDYEGPAEDFALVVPLPAPVKKDDVRAISPVVFDHLDALTAPRLVEYWEQDPCLPEEAAGDALGAPATRASARVRAPAPPPAAPSGVQVDAQFTSGEYEIAILGATESAGLEAWLRANGYKVPAGIEPYLKPYVQGGSKFLVAKVDVSRTRFEGGSARLSPLRIAYDSDSLVVPARIGIASSPGTQDMVVVVLAPHQRYEAANYPNVAIPTNLEVAEPVKDTFRDFYAALLDQAIDANPRAVVTEYAWSAAACDPCTAAPITDQELVLLGADELPSAQGTELEPLDEPPLAPPPPPALPLPGQVYFPPRDAGMPLAQWAAPRAPSAVVPSGVPRDFVVTRLHLRYAKGAFGDDLALRKAPPIDGGREYSATHVPLTLTADAASTFQARYVVRHAWSAAIGCDDPRFGVWDGPPENDHPPSALTPARDLAAAPHVPVALAPLVMGDVPTIALKGSFVRPPHAWHRPLLSRMKDPWAALLLGVAMGTLALGVVRLRAKDPGGPS